MTQIFDLGKLRTHFAGPYDPDKVYEVNDAVSQGGSCWVYINPLKRSGKVPGIDAEYWQIVAAGTRFRGDHDAKGSYELSDIAAVGATLYVVTSTPASGVVAGAEDPTSSPFWSIYTRGVRYRADYTPDAAYAYGDVVKQGGHLYIRTSTTQDWITGLNPSTTPAHWQVFVPGLNIRGNYVAGTAQPGDAFIYKNRLVVAVEQTTATPDEAPASYLTLLESVKQRGAFNAATQYFKGDLYTHRGNLYYVKTDFLGGSPSDAARSEIVMQGMQLFGLWSKTESYVGGNTVIYGGTVFYAKRDNQNKKPFAGSSDWGVLIEGMVFTGNYEAGRTYLPNEAFYYYPSTYRVVTEHVAPAEPDMTKLATVANGTSDLPSHAGKQGALLTNGDDRYWGDVMKDKTIRRSVIFAAIQHS